MWTIEGPDFKFRTDSLRARATANNRVFSGIADYTDKGQPRVLCFSVHYYENSKATVTLRVPAAQFEAVLPAFQQFTETIRLRENSLGQPQSAFPWISLPDVVGADNVVHDRDTGIAAVLPSGWKAYRAYRTASPRAEVEQIASKFSMDLHPPLAGNARLAYFVADDQKEIRSKGMESWLRHWATTTYIQAIKNRLGNDYQIRPESFSFHGSGAQPRLSWVGDYTSHGVKFTQLATVIYSDNGNAWVRVQAPANEIEKARADFERLVASVRLP